MVSRRIVVGVLIAAIIAVAAIASGYYYLQSANPSKLEVVELELDWVPQGRYIPLFIGLDKGWFEEEGISLRIFRGYGTIRTLTDVESGLFDIGMADTRVLIKARADGLEPKVIWMYYGAVADGLGGFSETGLNEPKDLEGKSFAVSAYSSTWTCFPLFCKLNNVNISLVQVNFVSAELQATSVLAGQADFCPAWVGADYEILVEKANEQGKEISAMWYRDYGIEYYGHCLFSTDKIIEERPDMLRRFLKVLNKAYKYCFTNVDEVVNTYTKKYWPELDFNITKLQWLGTMDNMNADAYVAEHGWGWVEKKEMELCRDQMLDVFGLLNETMPAEDLYTNEFLPGK